MPNTDIAPIYKTAMDDLRAGRSTPDDFRTTVRTLRATYGDAAVDRAKMMAIASSNR
jgi:hypothetical protein